VSAQIEKGLELTSSVAAEINSLHKEIRALGKTTLTKAIRIGELLTLEKAELKHGDWLPWIEKNLEFGPGMAQRYVRIYSRRDELRNASQETHLTITDAYARLANKGDAATKRAAVTMDISTVEGIATDLDGLSGQRFGTIYADPPWDYDNQSTRAATSNHYESMTIEQLCELPIPELSADKCHLHLWTTNAFLFECPRIFEAWGFEFKSTFVWVKPQLGIGNYWRNSHEIMLLAIKGGQTARSRSERSWIECGRGIHSSKPEQVRRLIERLSPGPYLELFGRAPRTNWTVFGNQIVPELVQL
jgi:N6-adenosine-specific RNA methylase IME4